MNSYHPLKTWLGRKFKKSSFSDKVNNFSFSFKVLKFSNIPGFRKMPVTQTREFFLLSSKWNESVIQSLQDRAIRHGKFPRYARGGVVVEWNSNGSERVRAIFPIYRFPICFKYSGSIDSLNRCYFILQHIPRFDPLSPSLSLSFSLLFFYPARSLFR